MDLSYHEVPREHEAGECTPLNNQNFSVFPGKKRKIYLLFTLLQGFWRISLHILTFSLLVQALPVTFMESFLEIPYICNRMYHFLNFL